MSEHEISDRSRLQRSAMAEEPRDDCGRARALVHARCSPLVDSLVCHHARSHDSPDEQPEDASKTDVCFLIDLVSRVIPTAIIRTRVV